MTFKGCAVVVSVFLLLPFVIRKYR